jgi:hypothetical protein
LTSTIIAIRLISAGTWHHDLRSAGDSTSLDQPWSATTAGPWQLLAAMPELEKFIDDKRHS